jgi:hypothetical protein
VLDIWQIWYIMDFTHFQLLHKNQILKVIFLWLASPAGGTTIRDKIPYIYEN